MQKNRLMRDRRGFSTLLLLVLGFVFFLVTSVVVYQIQSENDQMVDATRSQTSESRLDFIAQSIQADFYNTFLQEKFENVVVEFLIGEEHIIDPQRSFKENMGGKLEQYLSEAANSLMREGTAAQLYSKAYSAVPSISCRPKEISGGSAQVWLRETEGVLELGGMSVGQRIFCEDMEESNSQEISLMARNYQLFSRAIQMHDMAVRAIKSAKLQLDGKGGVSQITSGWRLASDVNVKSQLLNGPEGWMQKARLVSTLMAMEDDEILLEPMSVSIRNGGGEPFTVNDITRFVCYGDVKRGAEGNSGPAQTCRPDDIELVLGEDPPQGDKNLVELKFKQDPGAMEISVTIIDSGIKIQIKIPPGLVKLVKGFIQGMVNHASDKGYAKYSGVTHLCNAFRGKPNSVTVFGSVMETKEEFLPYGVEGDVIRMRFRSTPQSLDTSSIVNDVDCTDEENKQVVKQNVIDLLTNDGTEQFQLRVSKGPDDKTKLNQDDVNTLQQRIRENSMFSSTGENRVVNLRGKVLVNEQTVSITPSVKPPPPVTTPPGPVLPPQTNPQFPPNSQWPPTPPSNPSNPFNVWNWLMNKGKEAAGTSSRGGSLESAEAAGRAATAICKLMGLKNWMDLDDTGKALMAICGIGNVFGDGDTKVICDLAGLYQAIDSGSMRSVLAMLANLLDKQGFDFVVTANMIEAALQTGDIEDVLMAASAAARLAGDIEAADYLAQLAQVIHGIERGDVLGLIANLLSRLGDHELANLWAALDGMWKGVENGDYLAALRAMADLAKRLGYEGADLGMISQIQGNFDMAMDFGKALESCKDETNIIWDFACTVPAIGGGVCPDERPCIGGGIGTFSEGYPTFDLNLLCNEMFFDFGFQIDCTCVYACATTPNIMYYPRSVRVDINQIMMLLDEDFYSGMLGGQLGGLLGYCKLDP